MSQRTSSTRQVTRRTTILTWLQRVGASATQAIATFLLVSGTVILVRWLLQTGGQEAQYPTTQFNSALGFAVTGAGLLLLGFHRRRWVAVAGTIVLLMGAVTLLQYATGLDLLIDRLLLPMGLADADGTVIRMAPNAAIGFLLSGGYLFIAALPDRLRWRAPTLGVAASILVGLAGMTIIGYVSGVQTAYAWKGVPAMTAPTAWDFLLLSAAFWAEASIGEPRRYLPRWAPAAAVATVLTLSIGLWLSLNAREQAQVRSSLRSQTAVIERGVQDQLQTRTNALDRMAARWEMRGGTPPEEWLADAQHYVESEREFELIMWADRELVVRGVAPLSGNQDEIGKQLTPDEHTRAAMVQALTAGIDAMSEPGLLSTGVQGFLIYVPLYVDGQLDGLLIGTLDAEVAFAGLPQGEGVGEVSVALLDDDGRQFFGPDRAGPLYQRWVLRETLPLLNEGWLLEVWPTTSLIDAATTAIPEITLVTGAIISALLGLTILGVQRNQLRADDLERTVQSRTSELSETVEALAKSERRYSELYDQSPDMFVSIDARSATILRCNRTLAETIGVSKQQLIGRPMTELYDPGCHSLARRAFDRFLQDGEALNTALKLLCSDGSTVDVSVNNSAIRDAEGQILYSSAVIRDVTAITAAERERDQLLEAERDQRRIAESLGRVALALSATLDLENLVELICKESVSLFGIDAAFVWLVQGNELVGRAGYGAGREHFIGTSVPLSDQETLAARVIHDRRPIYVNQVQTAGGANPQLVELFQVQSLLGVPLLKGLQPIGTLVILDNSNPERFGPEDLAMAAVLGSHVAVAVENARLYEQEKALAQMKDDFVAHVSHELRTPLHTLRGFVQLLRSGKVDDPKVEQDFLARASHDVDRLTEQVNELLEAARIDANGLRLAYEPVDVGQVVQQTLDSIRIIADDRGVELRNLVPPQGLVIASETRRLRQVVRNLVENAVQFSEAGSTVEVESANGSDELRLMVRDQGPGIPPEAIGRLFDRFYQVDKPERREKGGVGLGLYITRMIVEAHGGRIEVESAPGAGSTFQAYFPVEPPDALKDGQP